MPYPDVVETFADQENEVFVGPGLDDYTGGTEADADFIDKMARIIHAEEVYVGTTADPASATGSLTAQIKALRVSGGGLWATPVASATTVTLTTDGEIIPITGTTNITDIAAPSSARKVILEFDGVLTLSGTGTHLALNGNYVTQAGDMIMLAFDTVAAKWREVARSRAATTIVDGSVTTAKLADLAVTAAKIAAGTITDTQVAAANKDGPAATPGMRTIGSGALQAAAGSHSHAGVTGIDVQENGGAEGNATVANFTGAGVTVGVGGGVATINIPGSSLPGFATVTKFMVD